MANASASVVTLGEFRVQLWLHTTVNPDDATWNQAIAHFADALAREKVPADRWRSMVISDGGAPNTRQRGTLFEEGMGGIKMPASVVTTELANPIKRGIATALGWVNPNMKFFEPARIRDALAHMGLGDHWPDLMAAYDRMQAEIPTVRSLTLAKAAMAER